MNAPTMTASVSGTPAPAVPWHGAAPSHEVLGPGARRVLVGTMLGAHLLAGWALLQVPAVRQAAAELAPIMVDLIAPVPQAPPKPVPPPPRPVARAENKCARTFRRPARPAWRRRRASAGRCCS